MKAKKQVRYEKGTELPIPVDNAGFKEFMNKSNSANQLPTVEGMAVILAILPTIVMNTIFTPNSHRQAMDSPQARHWRASMPTKYDALIRKGTWEPVARTKDHKIGSKWTYKIKQDADGNITKFKSRIKVVRTRRPVD